MEGQYPDDTYDEMVSRVKKVTDPIIKKCAEDIVSLKEAYESDEIDEITYDKIMDKLKEERKEHMNEVWAQEKASWPKPDKHVYYYTHPHSGNMLWTAQEQKDVEGGIPPTPQHSRLLHRLTPWSNDNHW